MDPAAALSGTETDQIPTCDIFAGNRASIATTRTEPLSHLSPLQLEERGALLESVTIEDRSSRVRRVSALPTALEL